MKLQKLSAASAKKHLSGISHCLKNNFLADYTKCEPVSKVMRGYSRMAKTQDLRLPISLELLQLICDILPNVCTNGYEVLLFRAAFIVAFSALLRVSELTAIDKRTNGHAILFSGINISDRSVTLLLPSSKTDQAGKGMKIHLSVSRGQATCRWHFVLP